MTLLSDHADVLLASVSSVLECEALDQKLRHEVQSTMEAVLSIAHRAIATYSERWNARTAVFPPELLIGCFEFLGFDDCLRVSGVSRHWRRIALSTPQLWSSFAVPYSFWEGKGKLEEMLRRSQAVPLSVQVHGNGLYTDPTREVLRPHFGRIISLKSTERLANPADMPLLDQLECSGHYILSKSILGRSSQRLRVLRLNRFAIDSDCPSLTNLREFRGEFIAQNSLSRLLSLCPSLESLAIRCYASLGADPRALFVALPPSLLELSITGLYYSQNPELDPTGTWTGHRFRRLEFSCLRNLSSAFRLFESTLSPSNTGWSIEILIEKKILYTLHGPAVQMHVEGPGYTYPLAIEAVSNLHLWQVHLRRLTSLSLPLRYLGPCVESGIALPALTDLTFTVDPERDHKPDVPDTANPAAMIVPRLQSFFFRLQCGSSDTIDLPTNAVRFFFRLLPKRLRTWMQYDAEMLEQIALIGTVPDHTLQGIDPKAPDLHALAKVIHIGQP